MSSRLMLFQVNARSVRGLSQAEVVQIVRSNELHVQLRMCEPRTSPPAATPAHSLASALPPGYDVSPGPLDGMSIDRSMSTNLTTYSDAGAGGGR